MKRTSPFLDHLESQAFDEILSARDPEDLRRIVDANPVCITPAFVRKAINELQAEHADGLLRHVLHLVHRAAHRSVLRAAELTTPSALEEYFHELAVVEEATIADDPEEREVPIVPRFFADLVEQVGDLELDVEWNEPRLPTQAAEIRDDLARVGIENAELVGYEPTEGISWTLAICICRNCKRQALLARAHFIDADLGAFLLATDENHCRRCGSASLVVDVPWVQEAPFTDELNALATLVKVSDTHVIYRPPAWGYTPEAHGVLLGARANDLVQSFKHEGFLRDTATTSIVYSPDEYAWCVRRQRAPDLFHAFAASCGFELEYRHATIADVMNRAAAYAATLGESEEPRPIRFGSEYPWRQVAVGFLNEELAARRNVTPLERAYFSVQLAGALTAVHQLAAAESAVIRAEEFLKTVANVDSDEYRERLEHIAVIRADILARDGRYAEAQQLLEPTIPTLSGMAHAMTRVRYWTFRRDQAVVLKNEGRLAEAIEILLDVIPADRSLMAEASESDDEDAAYARYLAAINYSGGLSNLASIALEVPSEDASRFVDLIMPLVLEIDGPIVATIPDWDARILRRMAIRLLEHALMISVGVRHHNYAARQRFQLTKACAGLGLHDIAERNALFAIEEALSGNDNGFAAFVALYLGTYNVNTTAYTNALYMAETAALASTRAAIDDVFGHNEYVGQYSADACGLALQSAEAAGSDSERAILVVENQKAVRAANLLSVALRSTREAPSELREQINDTIRIQEVLRAEALIADDDELLAGELSETASDLSQLRRKLDALSGLTAAVTDSRPVHHLNVSDARELLLRFGERTTLLGVYADGARLWVYTLWSDGAELHALDDWHDWQRELDAHLTGLASGKVPSAFDVQLSERLLRPLASRLHHLRCDDRLIISPFGPLALFPFDALVTDDGRTLGQRVMLSLTAGLGMLHACMHRPAFDADSILTVGDPARTLPKAPVFSREEALAVASIFRDQGKKEAVLLGPDATSSNVRVGGEASAVIHFACHGEWGSPQRPACMYLAETDDESGVLVALDIASGYRTHRGGLIVLAACESGSITINHEHDENAIVQAFMVAGASTVIATRWPIRDLATRIFMDEFYRHLVKTDEPMQALAATSRAAQSGELGPELTEPVIWAAFALFGR